MAEQTAIGGEAEKREDFGRSAKDQVAYWKRELENAEKVQKFPDGKHWWVKAEEVIQTFRGDKRVKGSNRLNILYSNTETMKPAMYSNTPAPDVRRRFQDARRPDPVSKDISIALERSLSYSVDDYDFDDTMEAVVEDFLLVGRGVPRVRYIPHFGPPEKERIPLQRAPETTDEFGRTVPETFATEGGVEVEAAVVKDDDDFGPYMLGDGEFRPKAYEEVRCEYVYWKHFRHSPARNWSNVWWVGYDAYLTKEELSEQFGAEVANKVNLTHTADGMEPKAQLKTDEQKRLLKTAKVTEIWDREDRKVRVLCWSYDEGFLDTWEDPLNLEQFFPSPKPAYFVRNNHTMTPIPPYLIYEDQAQELNKINTRIDRLVSAVKVAALYAGAHKAEVQKIVQATDNTTIAVEDWARFQQSGGLRGVIEWFPVQQIVESVTVLFEQRQSLKGLIFEITGLSDIMRGQSDPRETRGAQELKSRFGQLRLQSPKKVIETLVRDVYRLKAEIIAEKFDLETINLMTGQQLTDQHRQIMRDEGVRQYRIKVETETTILPDEEKLRTQTTEMMTALVQFMQAIREPMADGTIPSDLVKLLLRFSLKPFKIGRELEEGLETVGQRPQGQQGQPGQAAEQGKLAAEFAKIQSTGQRDQGKLQLEAQKLRQEFELGQLDRQIKMKELELEERELAVKEAELGIKAEASQTDQATKLMDAGTKRIAAQRPTGNGA